MRNYYITFRSVTFAQRAERILKQRDYRCTLRRTPRWMEEQGCGYSLQVNTNEISNAVELLRQAELPMRKVYAQRRDGTLEELQL